MATVAAAFTAKQAPCRSKSAKVSGSCSNAHRLISEASGPERPVKPASPGDTGAVAVKNHCAVPAASSSG